jgi:hypothetical protein
MKGHMILYDETTNKPVGELNFSMNKNGDMTSSMSFKFPRPTWVDVLKEATKYAVSFIIIKKLQSI